MQLLNKFIKDKWFIRFPFLLISGSTFAFRNRHYFILDILFLLVTPVLTLFILIELIIWSDRLILSLLTFTLVAMIVYLAAFIFSGIYRRYWPYASIDDYVLIAWATFYATIIIGLLTLGVVRFVGFPLPMSLVLINGMLFLGLSSGARFLARYGRSHGHSLDGRRQRVLVFGAGDGGTMIVREMLRKPYIGYEPIAFMDDDLQKHKMRIHGIPVLGGRQDMDRVVNTFRPDCVIIAIPSASGQVIQELSSTCDRLQVKMKVVPGISEILKGQINMTQIRDLDIQDLLRRKPIRTDIDAVRQALIGRRVLVTGGGGSIGGELCRQILYCRPQELIILGHGENAIFDILADLHRASISDTKLTPIIADIRFEKRIQAIFAAYRPHVVFHAAAHKHVPLMEWHPSEAITNNVLGTQIMLEAAEAYQTDRFVFISTDKAVNPISIMGASKRVAEFLVYDTARRCGRDFVSVRFGNVLASRGSVVLTFKQQIAEGGPVTVTDPRAKRYFMTISEAVQLVLQASVLGCQGDVLVLDMGEPVTIDDLARQMICLYGLEPDAEIPIQYIGLRDGEKLSEELLSANEKHHLTHHEKIMVAENGTKQDTAALSAAVAELVAYAQEGDEKAISDCLQRLVSEFEPVSNQTRK